MWRKKNWVWMGARDKCVRVRVSGWCGLGLVRGARGWMGMGGCRTSVRRADARGSAGPVGLRGCGLGLRRAGGNLDGERAVSDFIDESVVTGENIGVGRHSAQLWGVLLGP